MAPRTLTSTRNHHQHWQHAPIESVLGTVGNSPETDAVLPSAVGSPDAEPEG
jgi:hypothetical protein